MDLSAPFASVSPTALNLVWFRGESGIPYADQIATFTNAKAKVAELLGPEAVSAQMMEKLGGWAELRHHALDAAIKGARNVLELAAGFSPRGLIVTKESGGIRYVATDLPGTFEHRVSVMGLFGIPKNLHLRIADATVESDVLETARGFVAGAKITLIHEGLFLYLTREQQLQVARNIRTLATYFPVTWHTPDIHTKEEFDRIMALSQVDGKRFDEKVGRSVRDNCFDSLDEAQKLFENAGFVVKRGEQLDHVAPGLLRLRSSDPDVNKMLREQHLWTMTPRQ